MSITVNGQSCVPPGFRFHPTEEELLNYYLRKKVSCEKIDLDVIRDVDLNKLEPWDIQEKCRIRSTPQNDWYFFSHKDKKYPSGTRTNRATAAGFWKATGRDKVIYTSCKRIGMRKTLVFYKGRAPHGQKSDWIMHEYRLDEHPESNSLSNVGSTMGETGTQEDGWVVCRVFKKKNLLKTLDTNPNTSSSSITTTADTPKPHLLVHSSSDGALDQILHYMGRSCKQEKEQQQQQQQQQHMLNNLNNNNDHLYFLNERFMKLPALESPTLTPSSLSNQSEGIQAIVNHIHDPVNFQVHSRLSDWSSLDHLVASHLNGQYEHSSKNLDNFDMDPTFMFCPSTNRLLSANNNSNSCDGSCNGDGDLWSLTSSASVHINDI